MGSRTILTDTDDERISLHNYAVIQPYWGYTDDALSLEELLKLLIRKEKKIINSTFATIAVNNYMLHN